MYGNINRFNMTILSLHTMTANIQVVVIDMDRCTKLNIGKEMFLEKYNEDANIQYEYSEPWLKMWYSMLG